MRLQHLAILSICLCLTACESWCQRADYQFKPLDMVDANFDLDANSDINIKDLNTFDMPIDHSKDLDCTNTSEDNWQCSNESQLCSNLKNEFCQTSSKPIIPFESPDTNNTSIYSYNKDRFLIYTYKNEIIIKDQPTQEYKTSINSYRNLFFIDSKIALKAEEVEETLIAPRIYTTIQQSDPNLSLKLNKSIPLITLADGDINRAYKIKIVHVGDNKYSAIMLLNKESNNDVFLNTCSFSVTADQINNDSISKVDCESTSNKPILNLQGKDLGWISDTLNIEKTNTNEVINHVFFQSHILYNTTNQANETTTWQSIKIDVPFNQYSLFYDKKHQKTYSFIAESGVISLLNFETKSKTHIYNSPGLNTNIASISFTNKNTNESNQIVVWQNGNVLKFIILDALNNITVERAVFSNATKPSPIVPKLAINELGIGLVWVVSNSVYYQPISFSGDFIVHPDNQD